MIITVDNKPTNRFALIKGEKKNIKFTIRDADDDLIDCSGAMATFEAKETIGGSADLSVADGSMDKTDSANGVICVPIDTTGLTHSTDYYCELELVFSSASIDHSGQIIMTINQPIVE